MLERLRVKNLALVKELDIEFGPGLNVITGETGAGKSIFIGALSLLLGERADKKSIRSGEDQCVVEAEFALARPGPVDDVLVESGLDPCEDARLILRRVIKASGSNQQAVNNSPVTAQVLQQLGDVLLDMHGPHDHQSLFRRSAQRAILDAFGHTAKELSAYRECYDQLQAVEERLEALKEGGEDVATMIDILRHRVQEIESIDPTLEGEEALNQEHIMVSNASRILGLGNGSVQALLESETAAFDALAAAQRMLEEMSPLLPAAAAWRDEVKSAAIQVQEVASVIAEQMESIEANPARLEWLDGQIAGYQKLKRKYGGSVASVLEALEAARVKLDDLESREERVAKLQKDRTGLIRDLTAAGEVLRAKRVKASSKLAKDITSELRFLGFEHGEFSVVVTPGEPKASGMDEVDFGFAPNLGEAMKPLREIASSGEISRVMLATKAVLAEHDAIPLLVFDEVDANVGGEMGHAIGEKLAALARSHQVLCITHLPQVAACGTSHYAVEKSVQDERTVSSIRALDGDGRVEELARMLGGKRATTITIEHAKDLLKQAATRA